MLFKDLKVGDKFRRYRWDGVLDPSGTIYTRVTLFQFAGKHFCNTSYVGLKFGRPWTYYDCSKDDDQVELAPSTG